MVFLVKIMPSPTSEIGNIEKEGSQPTAKTHNDAGNSVKKFVVQMVMTDIHITGQRKKCEAQEGAQTGC